MRVPLTRVYHAQKPSFWQRQHANLAYCREPNLIFALLTAQRICAISSNMGKNSCHSCAKLSAWWKLGGTPAPDVLRLRKISAYSKRSYTRYLFIRRRNWSRKATTVANTELDEKYENAWHSVAKPPRRRSGISREMSLSMRALSVVPRYAVAVGSLSRGNGEGENT